MGVACPCGQPGIRYHIHSVIHVTSAQGTILLAPTHELLYDVSLPIGGLDEVHVLWLDGSRENDGLDKPLPTPLPDS